MSIFQPFREFIDEVKREMEEEESRQKQNSDENVSSDEFLERLEQVRQSNRERTDTRSSQEKVLPQRSQRSQRRNDERQRTIPRSRKTPERNDATTYREDDSENYYTEAESLEPLSKESETDLYHARIQQETKASARVDDFWSDAGLVKTNMEERERKELLRQGIIMKEILDPPRSKKRRIR